MTPREFRTEKQKALHTTSVREGNLGVIYENPDRHGHPRWTAYEPDYKSIRFKPSELDDEACFTDERKRRWHARQFRLNSYM
eukprot:7074510-Karenia_brevis.AAC.1